MIPSHIRGNAAALRAYCDDLARQADEILTRDDATSDEITQLTADLAEANERFEQIDALTRAAGIPSATVPGDTRDAPQFTAPEVMRRGGDPWERGPGVATRDAALYAAERSAAVVPGITDAVRERAEQIIEEAALRGDADGRAVHEYAVELSNPDYYRAANKLYRDPVFGHRDFTPEEQRAWLRVRDYQARTAMAEGTTTTGGFMLPLLLDPQIQLTNAGTINPWRKIARVVTGTGQTYKFITSAGSTAEWVGTEGTEVADASPSLSQPTITAYKGDAYIQASLELIGDTPLSGQVAGVLADAKDRLEATAFTTGTGTGQPRGAVTCFSGTGPQYAGTSGAAGAADLIATDIFGMEGSMNARHLDRAEWVAHPAIFNKIRQLSVNASATNSTFWADFGPGIPSTLLGHAVNRSSDMDGSLVSGSTDDVLLLIDGQSAYGIFDRLGTTVQWNPMVLGANRRPTGEQGWVMWFRTGADALDSSGAKLLRL